jgi:hypothetical protein
MLSHRALRVWARMRPTDWRWLHSEWRHGDHRPQRANARQHADGMHERDRRREDHWKRQHRHARCSGSERVRACCERDATLPQSPTLPIRAAAGVGGARPTKEPTALSHRQTTWRRPRARGASSHGAGLAAAPCTRTGSGSTRSSFTRSPCSGSSRSRPPARPTGTMPIRESAFR